MHPEPHDTLATGGFTDLWLGRVLVMTIDRHRHDACGAKTRRFECAFIKSSICLSIYTKALQGPLGDLSCLIQANKWYCMFSDRSCC
jgi:hypothetical protein